MTSNTRSTRSKSSIGEPPDGASDTDRLVFCARLGFENAMRALSMLPGDVALGVLAEGRRQLDAHEAERVAEKLRAGVPTRKVEDDLRKHNGSSRRTASTARKRAAAVETNPDLGTKLANGDLSQDQTDVIAEAAAKTGGAAATDATLIDTIAGTTPEQGRKVANEFVRTHTNPADLQDEHDRHRRMRNVRRSTGDGGVHRLTLEGDRTSIDDMEGALRSLSNELYQRDGGRDVGNDEHPRTRDQRNFDAAHELLTRTDAVASRADDAEPAAATARSRPRRPRGNCSQPTSVSGQSWRTRHQAAPPGHETVHRRSPPAGTRPSDLRPAGACRAIRRAPRLPR